MLHPRTNMETSGLFFAQAGRQIIFAHSLGKILHDNTLGTRICDDFFFGFCVEISSFLAKILARVV